MISVVGRNYGCAANGQGGSKQYKCVVLSDQILSMVYEYDQTPDCSGRYDNNYNTGSVSLCDGNGYSSECVNDVGVTDIVKNDGLIT